MSAYVEIEPSEIRKGDTVRVEFPAGTINTAVEYIADRDNRSYDAFMSGSKHYLLDRPKPAVTLPSVPTLGWLSVCDAEPMLGRWRSYEPNFRRDDGSEYKAVIQDERDIERHRVTAFIEAVAVPKFALAKLWADHADRTSQSHDCGKSYNASQPTCAFLTAAYNASAR